MTLLSKFMVYRAFSDKSYFKIIRVAVPFNIRIILNGRFINSMISRWALTKNVLNDAFFLFCIPTIHNKKKISACFFSALQKKVLIPSMNFANHAKLKNLSVGKVCMCECHS